MQQHSVDIDPPNLRHLYWWSFSVRFAAGLAGWGIMYFSNIPLIADAAYYDSVAGNIASDWLNGRSSTWLELNWGNHGKPVLMVTVLACFYVLTLGFRALPVLIGLYCLLTSWAPVWIYHSTLKLGTNSRTALTAARMVAFLPGFVFWSAALYKEGLILLVISVMLYHALHFQQTSHLRSAAIVCCCVTIIGLLRFYLFPILGLTVFFALLLPGRGIPIQSMLARLLVTLPLSMLLIAAAVGAALAVDDTAPDNYGAWTEGTADTLPTTLEGAIRKLDVSRRDMATAASGYLQETQFHSLPDIIAFIPKGVAYFLVVPLPWQTGSIMQNVAIFDTALWLAVLYPMLLVGLPKLTRFEPGGAFLLIIPAIAMCCLYGVFIGNIGTAYRMRIQVWILLVPFVAVGWETINRRFPFAVEQMSSVNPGAATRHSVALLPRNGRSPQSVEPTHLSGAGHGLAGRRR